MLTQEQLLHAFANASGGAEANQPPPQAGGTISQFNEYAEAQAQVQAATAQHFATLYAEIRYLRTFQNWLMGITVFFAIAVTGFLWAFFPIWQRSQSATPISAPAPTIPIQRI